MAKRPGDWVASWRLTRRQLQLVARGILPRVWVEWARQDLATPFDPASFVRRQAHHRERRGKL